MDLLTFDFDVLRTAGESTNFYSADGLKGFTNSWFEWAQSETGARRQNLYRLLLTFSFVTSDDSKYQLLIWGEPENAKTVSKVAESDLLTSDSENSSMSWKSLLTSENRASVYSLANQENLLTFKIGKVVWLEKYLLTSGSRY